MLRRNVLEAYPVDDGSAHRGAGNSNRLGLAAQRPPPGAPQNTSCRSPIATRRNCCPVLPPGSKLISWNIRPSSRGRECGATSTFSTPGKASSGDSFSVREPGTMSGSSSWPPRSRLAWGQSRSLPSRHAGLEEQRNAVANELARLGLAPGNRVGPIVLPRRARGGVGHADNIRQHGLLSSLSRLAGKGVRPNLGRRPPGGCPRSPRRLIRGPGRGSFPWQSRFGSGPSSGSAARVSDLLCRRGGPVRKTRCSVCELRAALANPSRSFCGTGTCGRRPRV